MIARGRGRANGPWGCYAGGFRGEAMPEVTPSSIHAAIAGQAAQRPDAVAVVNNGVMVSYAALARNAAQFTQALAGLGLAAGQSVALQCGDLYLHLLLLLAADRIGAASASFTSGELAQPLPLLGQVDRVLTELPQRIAGARRLDPITQAWVASVLASQPGGAMADAPQSPNTPVRVLRTSGTTGLAKRIVLTRRIFDGRVAVWAEKEQLRPGDRSLIVAPYTFAMVHYVSWVALRAGATLVFENRCGMAEAVARHGVTQIVTVVNQLHDALKHLPAGFVKPPRLSLSAVGGRVSPELFRRALALLATQLADAYGTNEVGTIARRSEADTSPYSTIVPGVTVEIVDDADRPLPQGRLGRVRARGPNMVDSYPDDAEATARLFRQGWFYPGDLGVLHAPGLLEIAGRADDLLNLGGVKAAPEALEETFRARAAIDDVGVCTLPNADGIEELWVAVVYDAPDDRDIRARLKPAFADFPHGRAHLVKLAAIPRTDTGKIKRAELKAMVKAAAAPPPPG